jgi:hypothetical protein
MDIQSALKALEQSLARPSATPSGWRDDREVYLEECRQALREKLIDPVEVQAVAGAWAQQYANGDNQMRCYIALAREDATWLLYCPDTKEFAKAFGKDLKQPLSLLGFSSDDALAEWMG